MTATRSFNKENVMALTTATGLVETVGVFLVAAWIAVCRILDDFTPPGRTGLFRGARIISGWSAYVGLCTLMPGSLMAYMNSYSGEVTWLVIGVHMLVVGLIIVLLGIIGEIVMYWEPGESIHAGESAFAALIAFAVPFMAGVIARLFWEMITTIPIW